MAQIERVLHFLDTNGKPYNGDELRAALKAAEESGQTRNIQLHYFKVTFYKKGTAHIEFTNTDVLKSFNLYAGQKKGWRPPTYGKRAITICPPLIGRLWTASRVRKATPTPSPGT